MVIKRNLHNSVRFVACRPIMSLVKKQDSYISKINNIYQHRTIHTTFFVQQYRNIY